MFQPSASITETTASVPTIPLKTAKPRARQKRERSKPMQHFGLLPTKFEDAPSAHWATVLEVSAALRPLVENPRLSHAGRMNRAVTHIRSLGLPMRELRELADSMWSNCWGSHPSRDEVGRRTGALGYQACLLLAARANAQDRREAFRRMCFIGGSFGGLPKKAREGAMRRMIRDLRAMIEGDEKALPPPPNTQDMVPHDGRVEVPPYYLGKRYKRGDDLLLDGKGYWPKPKLAVGATYVLHPYDALSGYPASGYEGTPPDWMIGRIVRITRGYWFLRTPAPYSYVWKLPRRGWGVSGRVVGYQSGENFFRTDH